MIYGNSTQIPLMNASYMAKTDVKRAREYIFLPSYRATGREEESSYTMKNKNLETKIQFILNTLQNNVSKYEMCLGHIYRTI